MPDSQIARHLEWLNQVVVFSVQRIVSIRIGLLTTVAPRVSMRGRNGWFVRRSRPSSTTGAVPVPEHSLVAASGLFNADFYLGNNPDVKQTGADPLDHYLEWGGLQGRRPGPAFDGARYLQTYPDVKAAGINPLLHFIQYGLFEGREAGLDGPLPIPVPPEALSSRIHQGTLAASAAVDFWTAIQYLTTQLYRTHAQLRLSLKDQAEVERRLAEREERVGALGEELESAKIQLYVARSSLQRSVARNDALLRGNAEVQHAFELETQSLSARLQASIDHLEILTGPVQSDRERNEAASEPPRIRGR